MLIDVWMQMETGDCKMIIAGDGPDRLHLGELNRNCPSIE